MDPISEIKSRISVEQLVGQYVQLKKVGRNFRGLCPFHNEKTPSFYVSVEKQLAYCFGCRKGGDQLTFIQEIEGCDFQTALKMLAERAGVSLPEKRGNREQGTGNRESGVKSKKVRLQEAHEEAVAFYEKQLWESPEGRKVREYLIRRGLTEKTIHYAHLGFALLEPDTLYKYLLEKGFTRDEILSAGLAFARDTEQSECVDRFRMRLMFPIKNSSGAYCGFGGRAVKEGDQPKYLNSPETPIYQKSELLYGFSDAKTAMREQKTVVVVEGYMDVLAVRQAGIEGVVACSGTALTRQHILLLKRFVKTVILALDRDEAGKQATLRAISEGLQAEMQLKVASFSDAKDPDELCRTNPQAFHESLEKAAWANEYLLDYFISEYGINFTAAKQKVAQAFLEFCIYLQSSLEVEEWLKLLANRISVSIGALYDDFKRLQTKQSKWNKSGDDLKKPETTPPWQDPGIKKQEYILALLLTYPNLYSFANQIIPSNFFQDSVLENIYKNLTNYYNQRLGQPQSWQSPEDQEVAQRYSLLSLYGETLFADMTEESAKIELQHAAVALTRFHDQRRKQELVQALKSATPHTRQNLLEEYQRLI